MFSIGMATYDDFDGVYFTAMSLLAHHDKLVSEVIIIDNNPSGPSSQSLREFVQNGSGKLRYVPYDAATGTAQPRNEVFRQAKSEYVVCVDSHVLLLPNALEALQHYYNEHNSGNLLQGPMMMDNIIGCATHFEDVWNAEMWGVWGYDEREKTEPWFDIPAQGLGAFACRKDSWLGFNEKFRGFGGEEFYIHEKYRRAGRRALCVSGFRWLHRFGRPQGVPYPLTRWHKVRNYCIGLQEIAVPLDRCKKHFAAIMPPHEWDAAVRGDDMPVVLPAAQEPAPATCGCQGDKYTTLHDWFIAVKDAPSDINEHVQTLRDLAYGKVVLDCGSRHGVSTVALSSANALIVAADNPPAEIAALNKLDVAASHVKGNSLSIPLSAFDLVFLDTVHTGEHVLKELERWKDHAQRIAIHDSVTFGENGEQGAPGIMLAVRKFLRDHREWIVKEHYRNNNGLIVLSRDSSDRKPLPGKAKMFGNFIKAIGLHVVSGVQSTPHEEYETRLEACDICPSRNGDRCGECGCPIADKAKWKEQRCPLEQWPQ